MKDHIYCLKNGTDVNEDLLYQLILSQLLHDSHQAVADLLMHEKQVSTKVTQSAALLNLIGAALVEKNDQGVQCNLDGNLHEAKISKEIKLEEADEDDISVTTCSLEQTDIPHLESADLILKQDWDIEVTSADQSQITKLVESNSDLDNNIVQSSPPKRKRGRPRKYPLNEEFTSKKCSDFISNRKRKARARGPVLCEIVKKRKMNTKKENDFSTKSDKLTTKKKIRTLMYSKLCYVCETSYRTLKECSQHMMNEHFESCGDMLKCKICNKVLKLKSLRSHLSIHAETANFLCNICGQTFKTKRCYDEHMEKHNKKNMFCNICDNGPFQLERCLHRHIKQMHGAPKVKSFMCHLCSKCFSDQHKLSNHTRMHTGERPFQCNFCSSAFNTHSHLKRHEQQHFGKKKFTCGLCGHSVFQRSNMKVHMRVHSTMSYSETKLLVCGLCRLCFHEQQLFDEHTASKHPNYEEDLESLSSDIGIMKMKMIVNPPNQARLDMKQDMKSDSTTAEKSSLILNPIASVPSTGVDIRNIELHSKTQNKLRTVPSATQNTHYISILPAQL